MSSTGTVPFYKIREEPLHIDHVGTAESPYERGHPCLCGKVADLVAALLQIGKILLEFQAIGIRHGVNMMSEK